MEESSPHPLVVAFGSNLGDRLGHLFFAVEHLTAAAVQVEALSSVYETPPLGYVNQPAFLNMVGLASSDLPPRRLLSIFQSVEERAGRSPSFKNAPRPLDLDLLFFDARLVREPGLRIPHPRWKERSFVVRPLAEIAPGLRDPETGWSVHQVAERWPMEPQDIQVVLGREGFEKALKEWKV